MNVLMLIHEPHGQRAQRTLAEGQAAYGAMLAFAEELKKAGKLRAVESLAGDDQGVRVQVRQGRARAVDGPFTEAKEMVGGFFLLECADMAEATAIAERCPAAAWATVEVRPVAPCYM